ncbi:MULTISPECIES: acyl-CoA dehydrogenase family protein [unclassified Streptomyces]|uniref:acyl-CoA dehydrogenase family protein n=1 Tax=unclassified Streptomyces TaxID=2593676 RepID=UPI002DD8A558|nr:acyl-CoA dehydrogenase family protein [Streptomyces sp. NBC_01750]WSA98239.1 acyl-CoA dehydrogenase family protein [Streptomyces sp. NBC_01794]WSD37224.1 acyl-CoA dehydrogenase family protein [Streptomyces sp. NBC_01750]
MRELTAAAMTAAETTETTETTENPAGARSRWEADALARAARLERRLGDPYDPANPHGLRALFAADERRTPPAETEQLLLGTGLGAEFVPAEYGGRLLRADLLARALRPVFRRDVALGFGVGITSLFATSAVWAAGTEEQRRSTADLLLDGGRATILHHELAHANAILRHEFTARTAPGGGYLLHGRKDVIINASRADIYVAYARTDPARGPRSHSVLLLDPTQLPSGRVRGLPRIATPGMRGALFSGLEFDHCAVPGGALVGRTGEGVSLALRTFQINRSLICGVVTAAADTVLHSAVRAVTTGRSAPVARRWHKPLTGVFADLLACDSMATVALRALSLLPDRAHMLAAAVKYVVPDLLREDLEELAAVLGSRGFELDSPEFGALDKLARDLPVAGLGHAGTASCQAVIVPQLRTLAERAWFAEEEPPPELFRKGAELPCLDYRLLGIADGGDFMAASLTGSAARLAASRGVGGRLTALADLAEGFVTELRALREQCRQLPDFGTSGPPGPAVCVLSDRYCLVVAAAAVLGIWEGQDGTDPFLADPAWAVLALSRLGARLGILVPELSDDCLGQVLEELIRRYRTGSSCDLDATELAR